MSERNDNAAPPPGVDPPEAFAQPVIIYTTRWCGYCMMALRLLGERSIEFAQIAVDGNAEARRWLARRTGRTSVPQIFIGARSIGGYDDMATLDARGELASMVADAKTRPVEGT